MKLAIIGPGNCVLHVRRQVINWTNAGLLSIGLLGTYFSNHFHSRKYNWKYRLIKLPPSCPAGDELKHLFLFYIFCCFWNITDIGIHTPGGAHPLCREIIMCVFCWIISVFWFVFICNKYVSRVYMTKVLRQISPVNFNGVTKSFKTDKIPFAELCWKRV